MNHRAALALAGLLWMASTPAAPLWTELMATTERHVETHGPDSETADFLARAGDRAWKEHDTLFRLTGRFLGSDDPAVVAGAFEVLYRLRGYRPLEWIGPPSFEEVNAGYFSALDRAALDHLGHAMALGDDRVFGSAALFLGISRGPGTHEALRKIVGLAPGNEQAATCLAWRRDPTDMEILLPIMLGDSRGASSLPYQFRISYGAAAIPYLRKARAEAHGRFTRDAAAEELQTLEAGSTN